MTMNTDKPIKLLSCASMIIPNPWDGVPEEPDAEDSAAIAAKDLAAPPYNSDEDDEELWSEEGQEH
jgi:hypothetical protein